MRVMSGGASVGAIKKQGTALIAAIETSNEGRPLRMVLCPANTFRLDEVRGWQRHSLAAGTTVTSDEMVCFGTVEAARCSHHGTVKNNTGCRASIVRDAIPFQSLQSPLLPWLYPQPYCASPPSP